MDVAEIDGASNNGVDDVRMLRDNVKYPPLQGEYKVIIIDEVHMLSTSAFNALLKTLEEPPKHLVFVFATTEVQKVLPTILSRTQRYDFRRIQVDVIVALLRKIADADGIKIDDEALLLIAKKADGSARDAESIFDQAVAFSGMQVETSRLREALNLIDLDFFFEVSDAIAARDPKRAFELAGEITSRGYDIEEFFSGLLEHFRNILTVCVTGSTKLLEVSKVHQEHYTETAKKFSEADLLRLVRLGQNAFERLRASHEPRIVLEVALVEMMLLERAIEVSQLLEEVRGLKTGGRSSGNGVAQEKKTLDEPVTAPPPHSEQQPAPRSSGVEEVKSSAPKNGKRSSTPEPASAKPRAAESDSRTPAPDPEVVASRWSSFGEFLKTKSRPLHSILPDIEFCGVRHSTIYLGTPGKIEKDMLTTMKDEMNLALREFYGSSLSFEAGPKNDMRVKAGSPVVINPEVVQEIVKPKVQERSELEVALMEKLGAQEV